MKRNKLTLLIVSGILMASSSLTVFASSSSSSFNITGNIGGRSHTACDVDFGNGGNITMSDVNIDDIEPSVGSVSKATKFNVRISECPTSITAITALIDGTPDSSDHTMLALPYDVAGHAIGFGLQFLLNDDILPLKEESKVIAVKDGQANFSIGARYKTTLPHHTLLAGDVSASGQLVLSYK